RMLRRIEWMRLWMWFSIMRPAHNARAFFLRMPSRQCQECYVVEWTRVDEALLMAAKPYSLNQNGWPELPLDAWQDTYATLHMWTQIVGKVRLALSPLINHWWEVALYVNARGLTTSAIPYHDGNFEVQFDFID